MIVALIYGYLSLTQPFAFQKESSAQSLMGQIGLEVVDPAFQPMMESANCKLDKLIPEGRGRRMFPEAALICTFDTPCGVQVERVVWHKRLIRAYTSAEPLSWTIYEACPEMLNAAELQVVSEDMGQGG